MVGGGRPHRVSFHSTFWNRAQSCAETAAPQVSPGVVGRSLSSPRCLEAAGRRSAGVPGVAWLDLAAEAEQWEQDGLRMARWLHLEIGGEGTQEAWGGGHRSPGGRGLQVSSMCPRPGHWGLGGATEQAVT